MRTREPTALEHLARYPAATLDGRSREILRDELVRALERESLALEALSGDDEVYPEWSEDVAKLRGAIAEIDAVRRDEV
jgi:hypothetical protein